VKVAQKHPEEALKSNISGCLNLNVRRSLSFLVSLVVCRRDVDIAVNIPEFEWGLGFIEWSYRLIIRHCEVSSFGIRLIDRY